MSIYGEKCIFLPQIDIVNVTIRKEVKEVNINSNKPKN